MVNATIVAGAGDAADFVSDVELVLTTALSFRPYHGTLNLEDLTGLDELPSETVMTFSLVTDHWTGTSFTLVLSGIRGSLLRPFVADYLDEQVELVSPIRLRSLFGLNDGDTTDISAIDQVWYPNRLAESPTALTTLNAGIFDLEEP